MSNGPTDEALHALYEDLPHHDIRLFKPPRTGWRDRALARRLAAALPSNARVLDVGTNFGDTLLAMPNSYTLEGVELSAAAAMAAARSARLCIYQGSFESLASTMANERYDAVVSLAVIEHTRSPAAFLGEISRVLRPGGIAVIMTGDYATWNAQRLGIGWQLYHCDGHLHFFSGKSLERACTDAGLRAYKRIWSGPNPLTSRLPKFLARPLHCATTAIAFPRLFGRHPLGDEVYLWCRKHSYSAA